MDEPRVPGEPGDHCAGVRVPGLDLAGRQVVDAAVDEIGRVYGDLRIGLLKKHSMRMAGSGTPIALSCSHTEKSTAPSPER